MARRPPKSLMPCWRAQTHFDSFKRHARTTLQREKIRFVSELRAPHLSAVCAQRGIRHSSPSREDLESVSEFCRAAIWSLVWSPPTFKPTSPLRVVLSRHKGSFKAPIVLAARHPARRGTALPAAWAFAARVHSSRSARARIVGRSHRWAFGDWSGSRHSQMEDVASALSRHSQTEDVASALSRARCDGAQ